LEITLPLQEKYSYILPNMGVGKNRKWHVIWEC